jgi:hypothetical protein
VVCETLWAFSGQNAQPIFLPSPKIKRRPAL